MTGRAAHSDFLPESWAVCAVLLLTAGRASPMVTSDAPSRQEVIDRVKANEEKISLIKMDFSADFAFEGELPDRPRDPRAGKGDKVRREEIRWAQDGIRQRFVRRAFSSGGLQLSEITAVDGELCKSGDWPDLRRGTIREVSAYSRWLVNYASQLWYRPMYRDPDEWPLLSEVLAASDAMLAVVRQKLDDRDVFVLDVASGRVGCRRLYIDAERGLLLRSDVYSGPPEAEQTKVVQHTELTKVHKTDNGAWVALEGRQISYDDAYTSCINVHVDVNSISVNRADIPDSLFRLDFPEHTIVANRILDTASRGKPDAIATKFSSELHGGTKAGAPDAGTAGPSGVQRSNDRSLGEKAEIERQAPEQMPGHDASPGHSTRGSMEAWIMRQFGLVVLVAGATLLVLVLRRGRKT